MLDYTWLKDTLVSIAKDYIYPYSTLTDSSISTSEYSTIQQEFYPFSTTISDIEVYVKEVNGSPDKVTMSVLRDSSVISENIVSLNVGWNTISINKDNIVTKKKHTLQITVSSNTVDYYVFGTSTNSPFYWNLIADNNTLNSKLSFKIDIDDFIFKTYPGRELKLREYPVIVCDLTARPRINQPYLDVKVLEEILTVTFTIYSRYPDEIDILAKLLERGMFKKRRGITDIYIISPGPLSPIVRYRENVLSRAISFNIRMFVKDTE